MTTDNNLQFIREKIYQLGSAIMYNTSEEKVRIPTNIIRAVKVDEEGQLWFTARRTSDWIRDYEQSFPARLRFYRKGVFYYMEVSGKASIIRETYGADGASVVLMKMSLSEIEYTEPDIEKPKGRIERTFENIYKWMLRNIALPHQPAQVFPKIERSYH